MADINIERKDSTPWPWILLGLAAAALLLWYLFARGDDNLVRTAPGVADSIPGAAVGTDTMGTMGMGTGVAAGGVGAFLQYNDEMRAQQGADLSHEYTADGLRRLADALDDVAADDAAVENETDALRQRADDLQNNTNSTEHSRFARDAFVQAAGVISTVQRQRFPALESQVTEVRQAAEAVQPGTLLLEQSTQVQAFFNEAAEAIRGMSNTAN